jgi:hypothetical protein
MRPDAAMGGLDLGRACDPHHRSSGGEWRGSRKKFSYPEAKYDVCISLYILILDLFLTIVFLKFTYFIIIKLI